MKGKGVVFEQHNDSKVDVKTFMTNEDEMWLTAMRRVRSEAMEKRDTEDKAKAADIMKKVKKRQQKKRLADKMASGSKPRKVEKEQSPAPAKHVNGSDTDKKVP